MPSHARILGIFAKQPVAGQVKTRLAEATSAKFAQRVAHASLLDTLERLARLDARRTILYAPDSAAAFFADVARGRYELIPQTAGDLGQRLQHFFTQSRAQGHTQIVAIGADSPTLPASYVEQAFYLLDANDVVIGPASDGGYYLIGAGVREFSMFDNIPWSSTDVFDTTIARLQGTDARLATLPPWYDVDTVDDWAHMCDDIRALRRAGIDPGVPHLERLIEETSA